MCALAALEDTAEKGLATVPDAPVGIIDWLRWILQYGQVKCVRMLQASCLLQCGASAGSQD